MKVTMAKSVRPRWEAMMQERMWMPQVDETEAASAVRRALGVGVLSCRQRRIHAGVERSRQGLWRAIALLALLTGFLPGLPGAGQAQSFNSLFSFSGPENGTAPTAALIQASDGNLYGTTSNGGLYPGLGLHAAFGAGTVFKITTGGTLTTLYSFTGGADGAYPQAGLVQASDGNLYGTTAFGGAYPGSDGFGAGTVFKITTGGTLTTLYGFTGSADGGNPTAALIQATDGNLYGTTSDSYGTIFKITTGGTLTTLYRFTGSADGNGPSGLIQASDGNLYGTTQLGGANGAGNVFKIATGGVITTLYSFIALATDGCYPQAGLVQASDGNLYGMTPLGGKHDWGTVFRISTGGAYTSLYSFTGGADGGNPTAGLVQASDGNFYATTSAGGNYSGTFFKITTGGTLKTLRQFTGGNGDIGVPANLIQASDGNFYSTTASGGASNQGTVFKITAGGSLMILYSFASADDGIAPQTGLIQGADGNLYGTTAYGGAYGNNSGGTIFKITPGGTLASLYSFTGGTDGAYPNGLIQASDGNLYGTTAYGGAYRGPYGLGAGTVFKITTGGTLITLYSFTGGADGGNPTAGLVQASDGNLYATTSIGGTSNQGTIFKITTGGTLTTLYSFDTQNVYGTHPTGSLIQASDGNLYGTTGTGGNNLGTVFKITTGGTFTTVYSFSGGVDGAHPNGLIQASDGNLYGTASSGGTSVGFGTVFRITTAGTLKSLHRFTGGTDGAYPNGLIQGTDGNLYGTTPSNGKSYGTVFQLTTGGAFKVLYRFSPVNSLDINADGANPSAGVIQASNGSLYGTTAGGGDYGLGTLFSLDLPPVITSLSPSSADAAGPAFTLTLKGSAFASGSTVQWTSGGSTTSLTTVFVSSTQLRAAVPASFIASAGTATVTVANAGGKVSNNSPFTVFLTTLKLLSAKLTKSGTGAYTATINLKNSGYVSAPSVTITQATLGAASTSTTLPVSVGSIAKGKTGSASLSFPSTAGSSGSTVTLLVTGTFAGGSFSGSLKVTLP